MPTARSGEHAGPVTTTDPQRQHAAPRGAEPAGPRRTRIGGGWWRPLIGLVAAFLGLGLAQILAGLLTPSSAPVVAVGDAFIDLTPPWLKNFAVSSFGTADKTVLLTGAGLILAGLAATAGLLTRRYPRQAEWLVLGLGAVAALAAATRPDASPLSIVPSVVAAVVGAFTLRFLAGRLNLLDRATGRTGSDDGSVGSGSVGSGPRGSLPAARRSVLLATGTVAGAGAVAAGIGWFLGGRLRDVSASRAAVRLPAPAQPEPPLPAGVEVGVPGVAPFRVPNADFYRIDTALVLPLVTTSGWELRIHGMVEREVTLSWQQLITSPLIERDVTLQCVSNEVGGDLVGNARWLGLPIAGLLRQAGPHPQADMVLSTSADGWTASTPLDVLTDGRDAMLAIGMNGAPLPVEHGFPVRMVVPGLYGYVSATKWVTELKVTRFDLDQGYWTPRGWSPRGPIKTQSRIDVPSSGGSVKAGPVAVAGVAWAQHRGIRGVEVRVDGGAWQPARLASQDSVDTWRQWVFPWQATPGRHVLEVRATDGTGAAQTGERRPPAPDGATGWHRIRVSVN
jgi:DMSO/TMAO reductase YedYZ molybdopterin-dependent catalytic subunit